MSADSAWGWYLLGPSLASKDLLSPSYPHFAAPGCEISVPRPVLDRAGVPAPPAFAILASLPQSQTPSVGFTSHLSFRY